MTTRTCSALIGAALVLSTLGSQARAQSPVPTVPPNRILVDDMVLPPDALFGESVFVPTAWPSGNVFYEFASNISSTRRALFRKAMWEIEAIANVDFIESAVAPNRVQIINNTASNSVSYSAVGMDGGVQDLGVGSNHWAVKYILVHELYHSLGFLHEQSRPDRDTYVTINFNLVSQTACNGNPCDNNFAKVLTSTPVGAYDFESIMHYNDTAFTTVAGLPTIEAKPAFAASQSLMGNRNHMTVLDAQGMAFRYGGPRQPTLTSISPTSITAGSGGFTITVTGTRFFEGSPDTDGVQGTKVLWDFSPVETTFIDDNTVSAFIPASLVESVGSHQILIENDVVAGYRAPASITFNVTYPPCSTQNNKIGHAVLGIGDVNGDGRGDYLVGEPGYGSANEGRVRCFSGSNGGGIWTIFGTADAGLGYAMASLGDITGDGRADVVIGSPGHNNGAGRFQIYSGSSGGGIATVNYGTAFSGFGESVASVGDVDSDGDIDFLVGAPGYNNGAGRVELWSVNGGLLRTHNGSGVFELFGRSLAGGRDLGTDGVPDYVIGSPYFDGAGGADSGRIFIYSGASGSLLATRDGDAIGDYLGQSVAMIASTSPSNPKGNIVAGAFDGGGLNLAAGGAGYVRVYSGSGVTIPFILPGYQTIATHVGGAIGDSYGWSVCDAGDLDGDGAGDFGIGAIQSGIGAQPPTGDGYIELRSGRTGQLLHFEERIYLLGTPPVGIDFGWAVSRIGDTDGDGLIEFITGVPFADIPCPNAGDFDTFEAKVPPALGRILITEVSSGNPDGIEITNFGSAAASLSGLIVRWKDGSTLTSSALSGTLQPGEMALVLESGAPTPVETSAGVQIFRNLPVIGTTAGDFAVALVAGSGLVIDEVHVESTAGVYGEGSLGGEFRGIIHRDLAGAIGTAADAERAWGLDSNSGGDWYSFGPRSFGLENACSGERGTDPIIPFRVKINETDDSPDFIELRNQHPSSIDMRGWYLLASANQGSAHTLITPPWHLGVSNSIFSSSLPFSTYWVLGDTSTEPAELGSTVPYVNVTAEGNNGLPWTTQEYDCALYDSYGRLVDSMRTRGHDDLVAHNHPRFPSSWRDFQNAAGRNAVGDAAVGRNPQSHDSNTGSDFGPQPIRTMGFANAAVLGAGGFDNDMDVRLSGTALGGGLTLIINAGADHAGERWSFTFGSGHFQGTGPIVGLGPDALDNYAILNSTPPWFGFLDANGMARLDVPPLTVPSGIDTDDIFILQDSGLSLTAVSHILEFDT